MSYAQVAQHHKEKLMRDKQSEQSQDKTSVIQSNSCTSTAVGRSQSEKDQHKENRGIVLNLNILFAINITLYLTFIYEIF